jgi:hypothetical protein
MLASRARTVLAAVWVALTASACTILPAGHPPAQSSEAPVSRAPASTRAAPTTAPPTAVDLLSGFGATKAEWAAGHQMDPDGTGYWPRLANGPDTYTSVQFLRGRALRYTENLYPAVPAASALHVIGDELPPDARVVHYAPSPPGHPLCAQVVESSYTLQVKAGVEALVEMRSGGGSYDSAAVATLTFQPLTSPSSSLPAC